MRNTKLFPTAVVAGTIGLAYGEGGVSPLAGFAIGFLGYYVVVLYYLLISYGAAVDRKNAGKRRRQPYRDRLIPFAVIDPRTPLETRGTSAVACSSGILLPAHGVSASTSPASRLTTRST